MIFMKQVKIGKSISGTHFSKTLPRLEYLPLDMNMLEMKRLIYQKIKKIYKDPLKDDTDINRCILLHIYDNLPMERINKNRS